MYDADVPETPAAEIQSTARNRYPWEVWTSPGAGPFLVKPDEADPKKLSSVLRTHAARKKLKLRMTTAEEGLVFQFGPPFSPVLDAAARKTVPPGTELEPCPTCGSPVPAGSLRHVHEPDEAEAAS